MRRNIRGEKSCWVACDMAGAVNDGGSEETAENQDLRGSMERRIQDISRSLQDAINNIPPVHPPQFTQRRRRSSLPTPQSVPLKRTQGHKMFPHLIILRSRSTPFGFSPKQNCGSKLHTCLSHSNLPHLPSKRRASDPIGMRESIQVLKNSRPRRNSFPLNAETIRERQLHRCPAHHRTMTPLEAFAKNFAGARKIILSTTRSAPNIHLQSFSDLLPGNHGRLSSKSVNCIPSTLVAIIARDLATKDGSAKCSCDFTLQRRESSRVPSSLTRIKENTVVEAD